MTTDEIKDNNPITTWVQDRGHQIKRIGGNLTTNTCPDIEHGNGHQCVSIEPDKNLWHCNDCGTGGSVIDWLMKEKGIDLKQAITDLGGDDDATVGISPTAPINPAPTVQSAGAGEVVKTYDYTNENNQLVFQVLRYEPKSFRQRQPKGEEWQWNLDGVTRVLYNLSKVISNQYVCLVEGEKDADTLNDIGFIATTNCGGSSAWLPAYAATLKGKDVFLFPDNDKVGEKLYNDRLVSLDGKVKSAKRISVPKEFKDVTEWLESFSSEVNKREFLLELMDKTAHAIEPLPLYTIEEMEDKYRDYVQNLGKRSFSLMSFSPKFDDISKRVMPGELVMVMGDTGQGKTAVMQAIAQAANPTPTVFFQLELPLTAMYSRSIQMAVGCYEEDVLNDYKNAKFSMRERFGNLKHMLTCDKSGITMDYIEKLITMSELKFGTHPVLVMIDYMGLVKTDNRSRYEAMAEKAQRAKVLAKNTNTIVFMGSQVGRPQWDAETKKKSVRKELGLHDARGAGELEESSNLVLGVTRPEDDTINIKVLKNTRGPVGGDVQFHFDGQKMQLTPL